MKMHLTTHLEIKSLNDREFEGHGSIFGNEDLGGDIVMKGAFKRSLKQYQDKGDLPLMFWMHDPSRVAGKWTEMNEDDSGLRVKGVLADTPLGNEIRTLLHMDAVKGLSIGYRTIDQDYNDDGQRELKEIDLWEVSVVSLPMNPLAQVAHAKSQLSAMGEYVPTAREFERTLRDVGCSQKVAKRVISKIFDGEKQVREVPDLKDNESTPEVEDSLRDVEVEHDDVDLARAANLVAERLFAATIRTPKL